MAPPVTADVRRAVEVLREGGLVAIPTETVYGLAARADLASAVARVYEVKNRPLDHPLIVHVSSLENASALGRFSDAAGELARRFWPGPLTLLVERTAAVADIVTGGRDTVAIRVPDHPLALELLDAFPAGLVAPSANRFGRVSPTTARHVVDDLGDDVDLVLDGGPCPVGVESTIVDCTVDPAQILRPGGIGEAAVGAVIGELADAPSGPSRAPGMLASHYAPRCRIVLADGPDEAGEAVESLVRGGSRARLLDESADPAHYARILYDELRRADSDGIDVVVAVLPDDIGIGRAIRDRLTKAAHRPSNEGSRFSR